METVLMQKEKGTKYVTWKIPIQTIIELKHLAADDQTTIADQVNQALKEYVEKRRSRKK